MLSKIRHGILFGLIRTWVVNRASTAFLSMKEEITIPLEESASHIVVIGLPGMGKTRFAEILIGQDIRRGDVVIVLDPKVISIY